MKVKFLGAIGRVTGSCSLLEIPGSSGEESTKFLIDCGMVQGEADDHFLNSEPWPFTPAQIRFVLLTHAHLDHCGLLARLVRDGFTGPVYCSRFTASLAAVIIKDSARLGSLYNEIDVRSIRFVAVDELKSFTYSSYFRLTDALEVAFFPSAHIGGACSIGLRWQTESGNREIVFSGDLGPNASMPSKTTDAQPLLAPRRPLPASTDYLLMESTYGSRTRDPKFSSSQSRMQELQRIFTRSIEQLSQCTGQSNPCVVIPSFSIHRTQELIVDLHSLFEVHLREKLYTSRKIFENDGQIEKSIVNGLAPRLLHHRRGIFGLRHPDVAKRFFELFRMRRIQSASGKAQVVYTLIDESPDIRNEARTLLELGQKIQRNHEIKIFVDSPMGRRATTIYQKGLCDRPFGDDQARTWRNPALKDHFGVTTEAEVDSILQDLFSVGVVGKMASHETAGAPTDGSADAGGKRCVTRDFITYSITYCAPDEAQEIIAKQNTPTLNVVISGSGMADVGPITSHLKREISNPLSTVVLCGYGSPSSVAGRIRQFSQTGFFGDQPNLVIDGVEFTVNEFNIAVEDLGSFYSGHADQNSLLDFGFIADEKAGPKAKPLTLFLNHGSDEVREELRKAIFARSTQKVPGERRVVDVHIPDGDHLWFDLDTGKWLPQTFELLHETTESLLARLLTEQRRTNDLLTELLKVNKYQRRY